MGPTRPMSDAEPANRVNEREGAVLGLIAKEQPLTRYKLFRAFQRSPTTSFHTSKGSLYPVVSRMIDRGLVSAEMRSGGRASELLSLTDLGRQALSYWIDNIGQLHSFAYDPVLLRVMSLGDHDRHDRVRWIADTKAMLLDKKAELKANLSSNADDFEDIVHGTAIAIIDARLEWLDRLLIKVVQD